MTAGGNGTTCARPLLLIVAGIVQVRGVRIDVRPAHGRSLGAALAAQQEHLQVAIERPRRGVGGIPERRQLGIGEGAPDRREALGAGGARATPAGHRVGRDQALVDRPAEEHGGARFQLAGGAGAAGCLDRGDPLDHLRARSRLPRSTLPNGRSQLAAQQRHDLAALDHLSAREMRPRRRRGRRRAGRDRASRPCRSPAGSRPVAISPMRRRISRRASPSGILPASRVRRRCSEPRPPAR